MEKQVYEPTDEQKRKLEQAQLIVEANEMLRKLPDYPLTEEQVDAVLLKAGFNPRAVRAFARALIAQEAPALKEPPGLLDERIKWALRYLRACIKDLFDAGGDLQPVMMAVQSLPNFVKEDYEATAKAKARKSGNNGTSEPTGGNGVRRSTGEGEPERNTA